MLFTLCKILPGDSRGYRIVYAMDTRTIRINRGIPRRIQWMSPDVVLQLKVDEVSVSHVVVCEIGVAAISIKISIEMT